MVPRPPAASGPFPGNYFSRPSDLPWHPSACQTQGPSARRSLRSRVLWLFVVAVHPPRAPMGRPNTPDQLRSGAPVQGGGGGTGRHLVCSSGCRPELRQLHPVVRLLHPQGLAVGSAVVSWRARRRLWRNCGSRASIGLRDPDRGLDPRLCLDTGPPHMDERVTCARLVSVPISLETAHGWRHSQHKSRWVCRASVGCAGNPGTRQEGRLR